MIERLLRGVASKKTSAASNGRGFSRICVEQ